MVSQFILLIFHTLISKSLNFILPVSFSNLILLISKFHPFSLLHQVIIINPLFSLIRFFTIIQLSLFLFINFQIDLLIFLFLEHPVTINLIIFINLKDFSLSVDLNFLNL